MIDSTPLATTVEKATLTVQQLDWWIEKGVEMFNIYGLRIVTALLILIAGRWVARRFSRLTKRALSHRGDPTIVSFTGDLIYYLLLAIVIVLSLGSLGVETTSLIAILGTAGIAIGLAMKDSLSNIASGFMIISLKPFQKDDYIAIAGVEGKVQKISLFMTTLNTADNKRVIIPNSAITTTSITNFSANGTRRVDMVFSVSYKDNLKVAKETLAKVIAEDSRILADPEPIIAVRDLAESGVNIIVRPWTLADDYWPVYYAITEQGKVALEEAGCSIPFPQRDFHVVSGSLKAE